MSVTAILTAVWHFLLTSLIAFWPWVVGVASAILAFLFSPTLRKYTLAVIAIVAILVVTFIGGYRSNHTVQTVTHSCSEFRKVLVTGPATDKAIRIFQKHGLCR